MSFKVLVDAYNYATGIVDISNPEGYEPPNIVAFYQLVLPKWNGVDDFIEGYDSASYNQKLAWLGESNFRDIRATDFFNSISVDSKGRIPTAPDCTMADKDPQWFSPTLYTSTGNGNLDIFDLQLTEDTWFSSGEIIHDSTVGLPFGVDLIDMEIVDIDDVLGYGPLTVLNQFMVEHKVIAGRDKKYIGWGTKMIVAGLYLRVKYQAAAGSPAHKFAIEWGWRR